MSRNRALQIENAIGQREEHVGNDHQPAECIEDAGQLSPHQCDGPHAKADQAPEGEKKLGFEASIPGQPRNHAKAEELPPQHAGQNRSGLIQLGAVDSWTE